MTLHKISVVSIRFSGEMKVRREPSLRCFRKGDENIVTHSVVKVTTLDF